MQTILLPTDFSPQDRHAVDYAAQLAGNEPAHFVLVHAKKVPDSGTPLQLSALNSRSYREPRQRQRRELRYLCRQYADQTFTVEEAPGSLPYVLSDCVHRHAADWVVMRERPGSWLEQLLPALGDHRLRLAARLPAPVLFVPEGASFTPPREIALFMSASEVTDTVDLQPLYGLAARYNANITGYTPAGERAVRYELILEPAGNGARLASAPAAWGTETVDWSELFTHSAPDLLVTSLPRQNPLEWLGQKSLGVRLAKRHGVPLLVL